MSVATVLPVPEYKIVPQGFLNGTQSLCDWLEDNIQSNTNIKIPFGTGIVDRQLTFNGISNVRIDGPGTLKCDGRFANALFYLSGGCEDWTFDNVTFDHNQLEQTLVVPYSSYYNGFVRTTGSTNKRIYIRNCKLLDIYADSIFLYQVRDEMEVSNCTFTWNSNEWCDGAIALQFLQTPAVITCTNNRFLFAKPVDGSGNFSADHGMPAIGFSGCTGNGTVTVNTILNAGRNNATGHRFGCIDLYGNCQNITITNNHILATEQSFRASRCQNIKFVNNTIYQFGPAPTNPYLETYSGQISDTDPDDVLESYDVKIINNTIEYVGNQQSWNPTEWDKETFDYDKQSSAFQISCNHNDFANRLTLVEGNTIRNCRIAITTTGSMDGITIRKNTIEDAITYATRAAWGGARGTATNERYHNVIFEGNICRQKETPVYTTCTVDSSTDLVTSVGHGFTGGERIYFKWSGTYADRPLGFQSLNDGTVAKPYYIIYVDPDNFKIEPFGGSGFLDITTDGVDGTLSYTTTLDVGSGGIVAGPHSAFTGMSNAVTIEKNYIEGNTRGIGAAISTYHTDVNLRDNEVDSFLRAFYLRGTSGDTIRQKGNIVKNCTILEDYEDARVINEQPIATATSLQFDSLAPVFAYSSLRKLISSYNGPCLEVRESGGDTLADIAFTLEGLKDDASLLDHVGMNSGFGRTLYDQSTSGNDLVQNDATVPAPPPIVTYQAQLVNAGSLIKVNNRNMLLGTGGATYYVGGSFTLSDFTVFGVAYFSKSSQAVFNIPSGTDQTTVFLLPTGDDYGTLYCRRGGEEASIQCPYNQLVQFTAYLADSWKRLWLNGVEAPDNTNPSPIIISSLPMYMFALDPTTYRMAGYISELMIVPGAVSDTNRETVEANWIEFNGITT